MQTKFTLQKLICVHYMFFILQKSIAKNDDICYNNLSPMKKFFLFLTGKIPIRNKPVGQMSNKLIGGYNG